MCCLVCVCTKYFSRHSTDKLHVRFTWLNIVVQPAAVSSIPTLFCPWKETQCVPGRVGLGRLNIRTQCFQLSSIIADLPQPTFDIPRCFWSFHRCRQRDFSSQQKRTEKYWATQTGFSMDRSFSPLVFGVGNGCFADTIINKNLWAKFWVRYISIGYNKYGILWKLFWMWSEREREREREKERDKDRDRERQRPRPRG